jgi:hypothetical protein
LLLCLAISAPVHAQDASDTSEAAASEDAGWSSDIDDSSEAGDDFDAGAISETDTEAESADAGMDSDGSQSHVNSQAPPPETSGKRLKQQLKRLLMGVLLPAVERRLAKASGESDSTTDDTEASPQEP